MITGYNKKDLPDRVIILLDATITQNHSLFQMLSICEEFDDDLLFDIIALLVK
jgi:hypothetical protein